MEKCYRNKIIIITTITTIITSEFHSIVVIGRTDEPHAHIPFLSN